MKRRPGTKRERPFRLTACFSECEAAALKEKATHAGMTPSAFVRFAALGTAPPRRRHVASPDEKLLAQLLAQLGKIGSNVNQLAHYAHLDRYQPNSVELAMRDLLEMRHVIMQALGLERPLPQSSDDAGSDDRAA